MPITILLWVWVCECVCVHFLFISVFIVFYWCFYKHRWVMVPWFFCWPFKPSARSLFSNCIFLESALLPPFMPTTCSRNSRLQPRLCLQISILIDSVCCTPLPSPLPPLSLSLSLSHSHPRQMQLRLIFMALHMPMCKNEMLLMAPA